VSKLNFVDKSLKSEIYSFGCLVNGVLLIYAFKGRVETWRNGLGFESQRRWSWNMFECLFWAMDS